MLSLILNTITLIVERRPKVYIPHVRGRVVEQQQKMPPVDVVVRARLGNASREQIACQQTSHQRSCLTQIALQQRRRCLWQWSSLSGLVAECVSGKSHGKSVRVNYRHCLHYVFTKSLPSVKKPYESSTQ